MSAVIDPVIHDRLTHYANRQRRWLVLRSALIAFAVWMLAILVVTWIDAVWIIERGTRSLLTLAAYALATVVFLALSLSRLRGRNPLRQAALAMEGARPEMHDRLLSAVELADAAERAPLAGSRAFILAAQRDMALKISRLDIGELLPLRVLRRPLVITAVLFAAAFSLVLIPNLHYGSRYARAIIPGIDLDRVSQTRITILRPDPASRSVPADELTAVAIRTSGRPAASALLQWESADGHRGTLTMHPLEEDRSRPASGEASLPLAVNLPVQQTPLRYRVLAGDGVTAWHRLQPQARPAVSEFEKEITPPPYARLPSHRETSTDGELRGLRGSTARLSARFDMPVVDATVRIIGDDQRIAMTGEGNVWTAVLPLEQNDRYQVLARSAETGFDNALSPQYAITAQVDQPPLVLWLQHDRDAVVNGRAASDNRNTHRSQPAAPPRRHLVTSRSTVSLMAKVADEMPIDQVFQETAINAGPWKMVARDDALPAGPPQATAVLQWSWDLTAVASEESALRPGDLIRTRVVAIDRKGQRGVSEVREYLISDQALDARRRTNVRSWATLVGNLGDWKEAVLDELIRLEIEPPTADAEADADSGDDQDDIAVAALSEQTAARLEQLAAMTRAAMHDGEAGELELLGRGIARIEADLARAGEAGEAQRKDFQSLRKSAELIENTARYGTAHRLSVTLADDLDRILRAMRPLVDDESMIRWESFPRYHQVTQQQFREMLELIAQMQRTMPDSTRNHNEQLRRWIDGWINRLADTSSPDLGEDRIRATTRDLVRDLQSRRRTAMLDGRLPSRMVEAHNRLNDLAGWTAPALYQAQKLATDIHRLRQRDGDSEHAKEAAELQQRLSSHLQRIAEQLDRDAEMNLRRGEADRRYVADARMLRRVLEIIEPRDYTPPEGKSLGDVLAELALAFHQLEAGHWWTQSLAELRTLADSERWEIDSADARLDAPMRWERIHRGLEHALSGLDRAKIPWELRQGLHQQQHNQETAKIASSITSRRWQQTAAISLADDLEAKHTALTAAGRAIAPALADARRRIGAYLPDLAEMARDAAVRLREAEQTAKGKEERTPKDAAAQLQQQQQQAQHQADKLREALADEANTQDLTTSDGLRNARDADIAARAIAQQMETAGQAVEQAAEQAQHQSDPALAAQAMSDAAQPLAAAAETLEQIAQHYENARSADPDDPSAVPSSLADLEQELGLRDQLDSDFARSQSLAETLQSDPRELLKKLSEELKRNERMQQELSEIAEQSIQDAQRSLQQQAEREHQLRLELEKQDPRSLAQKRQLEETIRAALDNAATVQRSMLHAAKQAGARMRNLPDEFAEQTDAAREHLEKSTEQLQQAAQEASAMQSAERELLDNLRQRAELLRDRLGTAAQSLDQSEQLLKPLTQDPAAALAADQQRAEQRDMQNLQRQARDTLAGAVRNQQNRVSQAAGNAEQQQRQIRSQVQLAEQQLREAEKRLAENSEDSGLRAQRQRAAARLENEKLRLELAQQDVQRRRQTVEQTKERLAEISRTPLASLDSQRPAAELAEGMQQRAVSELRRGQEELAAAVAQLEQRPPLQAAADQLDATQRTQRDVQTEVQRAAENLQRAARHQERLGDLDAAVFMTQTAEAVRQVADDEVEQARAAIAQAAQQARAPQQIAADADASNQALGTAEQAISIHAQALLEAIAQAADAAAGDRQAEDTRATSARQLAQTLDEIDRSLTQSRQRQGDAQPPEAADQPGDSDQPGEPGEPGAPGDDSGAADESASPTSPSSPTLAAAARRQMQQMAMQRMLPGDGQPSEEQEGTSPEGDPQDGAPGEGQSQLSGPGSQGSDPSWFGLPEIDPNDDGDWGRLRALQSDDTSVQRRVEVSPEFRRQIEAYFRVIAERAKGD